MKGSPQDEGAPQDEGGGQGPATESYSLYIHKMLRAGTRLGDLGQPQNLPESRGGDACLWPCGWQAGGRPVSPSQ